MIADILTKALPCDTFERFHMALGIVEELGVKKGDSMPALDLPTDPPLLLLHHALTHPHM